MDFAERMTREMSIRMGEKKTSSEGDAVEIPGGGRRGKYK